MMTQIEIPIRMIKGLTTYEFQADSNRKFPLITIDIDSYIVGARIETGINLDWESGIHNIQIGKYSAIAEDVLFIIDVNHDYRSVAQGYISAIEDGARPQKIRRKGQIIIENDCWIGHGVTLMGGVTVHNGAVVAANSMVVKDVPPYAIVGGNPARIIGYRFERDVIEKLLSIKWWDWGSSQIADRKSFIRGDVKEFVETFYNEKQEERTNPLKRSGKGKLLIYYLDMNEEFPVYKKVIEQYAYSENNKTSELVLYLNPLDINFEKNAETLLQLLKKYADREGHITIYSEEMEEQTDLMIGADYYITNRLPENLYRMCKAEEMGVICVSGVDNYIFEGLSLE